MDEPPIEAFLGEAYVAFDGRVVESFARRENAKGRVHIATLRSFELVESRRTLLLQPVSIWDSGSPFLIAVPEEYRANAEWFAGVVQAAIAQRVAR